VSFFLTIRLISTIGGAVPSNIVEAVYFILVLLATMTVMAGVHPRALFSALALPRAARALSLAAT
jgi:hypothetical protein